MSDIFGIKQAVTGVIETYFRCSRRTGRTMSMVESLKAGDCVCFASEEEARIVRNICKERGIEIITEVVNPKRPERIFERGTKQGRYIFDHRWVEEFYKLAIDRASDDIKHFQKEKSGYGAPHLETRRKAAEIAKWHL